MVGTTTFGKGLVQTVIPLRDGSALSLTSARYETAGGRDIDSQGIAPDFVVEMPEIDELELGEDGPLELSLDDDPQFLKAVEVLMEQIGQRSRVAG